MSRFESAYDAVACALQIQKIVQQQAKFQLKIGIHLGDLISDQNEIFGDGVIIATQLQQLAEPGGVYVSESYTKSY